MDQQEEPTPPAIEPITPITERFAALRQRMKALGIQPPPLTPAQRWRVENHTSDKLFLGDYTDEKPVPPQEPTP